MTRPAWIILLVLLFLTVRAPACQSDGLRLVRTIPLGDVEGRIDHMAVDVQGERLFVAALGNNTVEVVDVRAGRRVHTISGLHEPQGIGFASKADRLYVANGQGGALNIYDARTYQPRGSLDFSDDADNARYDAKTNRIYVGYGSGALAWVDAANGKKLESVRLRGHPESFQLERNGSRIFVNVPTAEHIAVVDRSNARVISTWPVAGARANFPMALDESHHRLLVGCRQPARLLVFDTASGREVASVAIDGDTDDVFCDSARKRIYVSCGAGYVDIIDWKDGNTYSVSAHLPTAAGARTSVFVPELGRLYLAVPHRGRQHAEIRVYAAG